MTGEAPCEYQRKGLPLHHPYVGESQLENTLKTIATESAAGTPVRVVTLNIGSNDELAVPPRLREESRKKSVKAQPKASTADRSDEESEEGDFTAEEGAGTVRPTNSAEKDAKKDGEQKGERMRCQRRYTGLFAQIGQKPAGILVLIATRKPSGSTLTTTDRF